MESKKIMWILMSLGGFLGGYIPLLWGSAGFTFSTILFNALGAILGIWVAFKITR